MINLKIGDLIKILNEIKSKHGNLTLIGEEGELIFEDDLELDVINDYHRSAFLDENNKVIEVKEKVLSIKIYN